MKVSFFRPCITDSLKIRTFNIFSIKVSAFSAENLSILFGFSHFALSALRGYRFHNRSNMCHYTATDAGLQEFISSQQYKTSSTAAKMQSAAASILPAEAAAQRAARFLLHCRRCCFLCTGSRL